MRVNLEYPIKKKASFGFGCEVELDHLILRRPTVDDLKGLNLMDPRFQVESFKILISRISGESIETIGKIDVSDWTYLGEAFAKLTQRGRN